MVIVVAVTPGPLMSPVILGIVAAGSAFSVPATAGTEPGEELAPPLLPEPEQADSMSPAAAENAPIVIVNRCVYFTDVPSRSSHR
jgi:hypothetical protein